MDCLQLSLSPKMFSLLPGVVDCVKLSLSPVMFSLIPGVVVDCLKLSSSPLMFSFLPGVVECLVEFVTTSVWYKIRDAFLDVIPLLPSFHVLLWVVLS